MKIEFLFFRRKIRRNRSNGVKGRIDELNHCDCIDLSIFVNKI